MSHHAKPSESVSYNIQKFEDDILKILVDSYNCNGGFLKHFKHAITVQQFTCVLPNRNKGNPLTVCVHMLVIFGGRPLKIHCSSALLDPWGSNNSS